MFAYMFPITVIIILTRAFGHCAVVTLSTWSTPFSTQSSLIVSSRSPLFQAWSCVLGTNTEQDRHRLGFAEFGIQRGTQKKC